MRLTISSRHRTPFLAALAGFVLLPAACGPANRVAARPDAIAAANDTMAVAAGADSLEEARDTAYANLDKVFPEIAQLEGWYREALQAVWNDDLDIAEQRTTLLDSALTEVDDDENPLASVYYQSLET